MYNCYYSVVVLPIQKFVALQGPFKPIPLHNTIIEEANIGGNMKHVFRLKPLKSNHEYLFQALNEDEEHSWMEAICFAKVSAHQSNDTTACILQ